MGDRYFPKVYALASRNIKDDRVAEELAMDLFFKLWQKRKQIAIPDNVSAYLLRSAKNSTINYLQQHTLVCIPVDYLSLRWPFPKYCLIREREWCFLGEGCSFPQ